MSWVISSGDDEDDDRWYDDDEVVKEFQEQRRREIGERANIAPCGYNNCLAELITSMTAEDVRFKVFGGAAYVHYECKQRSDDLNPYSPCNTRDVDFYLHDERENVKKFYAVVRDFNTRFEFPNLEEHDSYFESHPMKTIKWKVGEVDHGIDVHFVGEEITISGKRVRLWDDWENAGPDRHLLSKDILCETLGKMVKGGASSMDGETKASRRIGRYEKMCTDTGEKTIESGIANPYGGSIPPRSGLEQRRLERGHKTCCV